MPPGLAGNHPSTCIPGHLSQRVAHLQPRRPQALRHSVDPAKLGLQGQIDRENGQGDTELTEVGGTIASWEPIDTPS